jgi:lysozyme
MSSFRMRQPTAAALDSIKVEEALRLQAYPDFKGVPTIGYGSTRGVRLGMFITERQADQRLVEDVQEALRSIYRHLPTELVDSMPQACFDALVSFVFNVGEQAFKNPKTGARTDFYRAITTDLKLVPAQMQRWTRSGGRQAPGLVKRRGREASLWGAGLLDQEQAQASALAERFPEIAPAVDPVDDVLDASVTPDAPRAEPVTKQPIGVTGVAVGASGATAAGVAALEQANMLSRMDTDSVILAVIAGFLGVAAVAMLAYAAYRRFRK